MKQTIQMCPCESSRIAAHGYDAASNTLALQFKGKDGPGAVYHYANVTPEIYAEYSKAESIGRFFGQVLNDKEKFPYTRIEQEKPDDEKAAA